MVVFARLPTTVVTILLDLDSQRYESSKILASWGSIPMFIRPATGRVLYQALSRDNCSKGGLFVPNQLHVSYASAGRFVKSQYPYLVLMSGCLLTYPVVISLFVRVEELKDRSGGQLCSDPKLTSGGSGEEKC
jgi:hypothetical protein